MSDGWDQAQVQVSSDLGVAEVVEATTLKVFLNHQATNLLDLGQTVLHTGRGLGDQTAGEGGAEVGGALSAGERR